MYLVFFSSRSAVATVVATVGVVANAVDFRAVASAAAGAFCYRLATPQDKYAVPPDVVSYNAVISGHERVGEWREALAVARKMERAEGIAPTVVTYNSIIGACKRAGMATEALAVLGLLRRKRLRPDVISFNSAISACAG